jgi:hypothetical protein
MVMSKTIPSRRPNIFVASSTEALPIARAVKQNFDYEADVDIWNENIFKANRNYLDTLLNRASYYDFVIAVFTPDDAATIRKRTVKVTRDNVIFEFGLFLGRLGPNRTFLILQDGVELFSDWAGIGIVTFKPRENLVAAVGTACQRIREEMGVAEKLQHFTMLPSTSLAIGYYNNFLKRVFEAFEFSDEYTVVEKDKRGNIVRETRHQIVNRRPILHVMLPERLQDLESERLKERTANYKQIAVTTKVREFPFYIEGDLEAGKRIILFDIPTTMLSSKIAIDRIFSDEFLAEDDTARHLESREIANFERTLRIMVPDKIEKKYFKFSVLR